ANVVIRQPKPVIDEGGTSQALKSDGNAPEIPPAAEVMKPPFRTKDLVGSFAQHGIVCARYEPEQDFSTEENSTVFKLCETVDLNRSRIFQPRRIQPCLSSAKLLTL